MLFVFIWVRWTFPRFRYDQLMKLGWYFFFEIALVNIFITALVLAYVRDLTATASNTLGSARSSSQRLRRLFLSCS